MKVLVSLGVANNPDAMDSITERFGSVTVIRSLIGFGKMYWQLSEIPPNMSEYHERGVELLEENLSPSARLEEIDALLLTEEERHGFDADYFQFVASFVLAPVLNTMRKPAYQEYYWSPRHSDWFI